MADLYPQLDPRSIVVRRDSRQRQENINDVEDLRSSIKAIGIINPIVVRRDGDETLLVAGERRLMASISLGLSAVPIRFFDDLSTEEAEIVELEENVKRKELSWRDQVRAVGRIHILYQSTHKGWKIENTAEAISLHHSHVRKILHVFDALDSQRLTRAESIEQAYNTLHRFSERKAESIVGDIIARGASAVGSVAQTIAHTAQSLATAATTVSDNFSVTASVALAGDQSNGSEDTSLRPAPQPTVEASPPPATSVANDPILCLNFVEWARTYAGPKFSLIHCDFPYGNYRGGDSTSLNSMETEEFYDNTESVYWTLFDALTENLDKLLSYSGHIMFWFNMNFYTETVARFRKTGLMVHDHPLIWHKTGGPGGQGVVPGTAVTYPRRMYDTALLCVRGNRPLAKPGMNSYSAPTVGNKIHPSQKPEPMLRFFLQMLVDETTTMLDPTCGSGAAIRAAEDLGAKSVLGLELDPNYAQAALTRTLQSRVLRQAGARRQEELV